MQLVKKLSILLFAITLLGGCASGRTAFDKGQKFEMAGDLDQAVIKYAEAAATNPGMSEYRLRLLKASEGAARKHMAKGDDFLASQKHDDALREYQTAYALDPSLERAKQQIDDVMKLRNSRVFLQEGEEFEKNRKLREALRSYQKALELNPANAEARAGVERLLKTRQPKVEGQELNLKSTKPITLKFKDAKIKEVFNIISRLSGINFIFDEGVKDQNFSIFLENATFNQALEVITELNKFGKKVLNESTIIIYPKTPDKNKQYEELYVQTFYLNGIDAKKAVNLLRTMMQIKKIYVNEELNAIVIRDTPDVVELAGKILEANDIPEAEVLLEVEVIELSKKNEENFGFVLSRYAISTQGFTSGVPFSDVLSSAASSSSSTTAAGPDNLLQMFAWRQFSGFLTVPSATFNFAKTLSNGETLANPKIRVKNKEKSKFNVGTRVPITTTSSPTGGGVNVNVQYVDVGVKLNAEPTIQLNNEISIKLGMEVSSILSRDTIGGTGSATTVVTIGTRNLDTVLSLKDGETSVVGGLITDSKSKSKQKIALLGDIPVIGSIFSGNVNNNDKTELVLAITPHIVRGLAVPDPAVAAFWSGKEDDPSTVKLYSSFTVEPEVVQPPEAAAPAPVKGGVPQDAGKTAKPAAVPAPATAVPAPATAVPAPAAAAPTPVAAAPTPVAAAPTPVAAAPTPATAAPTPAAAAPAPQGAAPAKAPSALPAAAPPAPRTPTPAPGAEPEEAEKRAVLNISAPATVKVNEQFKVEVLASDLANLYNAPFTLVFDPAYVDFVGAAEGPFLKKDGKPTAFRTNVNKEEGLLDVALSRVGDVGGVSGSGTLAVITFKAKVSGSVVFGFGAADFTAPGGEPMEVDPSDRVVEIK